MQGLRLKSAIRMARLLRVRQEARRHSNSPHVVYAKSGWVSWGDWIGTGRISDNAREFRSFKKARAFVRGLGLKSETEWRKYRQSGKKHHDIPSVPSWVYAKSGWLSWGDWLGTGRRRWLGAAAIELQKYASFKKARSHARILGLKSKAEWIAYCRSGKLPDNIPNNPDRIYAEVGWAGISDWLGTGRRASECDLATFQKSPRIRTWPRIDLSYRWLEYCASSKKPTDIPANPNVVYADAGWLALISRESLRRTPCPKQSAPNPNDCE